MEPSDSGGDPKSSEKSGKNVDKVAVAVKHPGVFMETSELEAETGQKLSTPEKAKMPDSPVKEEPEALPEPEPEPEPAKEPPASTKKRGKRDQTAPKPTEVKDPLPDVKPAEEPNKEPVKETETKVENEEIKEEPMEATKDEKETKKEIEDIAKGSEIEVVSAEEDKDDSSSSAQPRRSKRREQLKLMKEEAEKAAAEQAAAKEMASLNEQYDEEEDDEDEYMEVEDSVVGERFDVESVGSELESVESGSTAPTSSSRSRRSAQRSGKGKKAASARSSKKKLISNIRGKSRRALFKRSATKAPSAVARVTTSDRVFYKVSCLFPIFFKIRDGNPVPRTVQMTFLELIRLVHNESSLLIGIYKQSLG